MYRMCMVWVIAYHIMVYLEFIKLSGHVHMLDIVSKGSINNWLAI